jgi:hypothetical protein
MVLQGFTFLLLEKASVIADHLENQFTPHDMCEKNYEWQVEAHVQGLSEAMDNSPPKE